MKPLPQLRELFETEEFKNLLSSFKSLEQEKDLLRREFALLTLAKLQRIPIGSYRRMFKSWLSMQQEGGES